MQDRIKWIDIAKGIGIVSVFYGHCTQSLCNDLFLYIYTYHMPLFFFISGLCFNDEKYSNRVYAREFMHKRNEQLLIPLVSSMVLFCFLNYTFGLGTYTVERLCSFGFPAAMWFVFSLLIIEMLYFALNLLVKDKRYLRISILAVSMFFSVVIARTQIILPANLSSVPIGMFFFTSGILSRNFMSRYRKLLLQNKRRYLISVGLLLIPLVYVLCVEEPINLVDGAIPGTIILPIVIAFVGICAILTISMIIEELKTDRLQRLLCYLGRNTLIILMFHLFFIKVSTDYLRPLLWGIGTEPLTAWLWIFITIPIVNRYLPFLAGKGFRRNIR